MHTFSLVCSVHHRAPDVNGRRAGSPRSSITEQECEVPLEQRNNPAMLVGTSQRRIEDQRLLIGGGQYLDDLTMPGLADVALVYSPYPHARILSIDGDTARAMPGVIAV